MKKIYGLVLAALSFSAILVAPAGAAGTYQTVLVSRATGASGAKSNGDSEDASISTEGRFVAFTSTATNLSVDDAASDKDVYVRDVLMNVTTLVSRATGSSGAKGNAGSGDSSISAGGRFVAFESDATNLIAADTSSDSDLYVRDLLTNETTLISRYHGKNGTKANGISLDPSISANGLLIAFDTNSTNLEAIDPSTDDDVYVRDQTTKGLTTLLSRVSGFNGAKGNGDSFNPSISSKDGRCVAFESNATNLSPDDTSSDSDIYVRQQR